MFRTETIVLTLVGFALTVRLGSVIPHALQWLILHVSNGRLPASNTLGNVGLAFAGTLVLASVVVTPRVRRATRLRPGRDPLRLSATGR